MSSASIRLSANIATPHSGESSMGLQVSYRTIINKFEASNSNNWIDTNGRSSIPC
jgi:hypothetical protein